MRHIRSLLLAAVFLTSCNPAGNATTAVPTSTTEHPGAAIQASLAGSDRLAVQFTYEGGMIADEKDTLIPPFSLYADGRLLVRGKEPSVSAERPVVRPADVIQLADQELLTAYGLIADIGLPGFENEWGVIPGRTTVADAGSTVVSYYDAAGTVHRYAVHALAAFDDVAGPEPVIRMKELLELFTLVSDEPERRSPVTPDRIQLVLLGPIDAGGLNLPWPLEVTPGDFVDVARTGPCHVLSGNDMAAALEAFAAGGVRTTWEHEGVRWRLWGRHLFEGEVGCRGPAA